MKGVAYCSGSPASANRFQRGNDGFDRAETPGCAAIANKKAPGDAGAFESSDGRPDQYFATTVLPKW
jgi:hypothetical protein